MQDSKESLATEASTSGKTARRFKDPIHDYIPMCTTTCAFIDTRQFQRLRNIKQLGTSYYVWPGASHNRFEHCLGVAYLARRMAEHLQASQPELNISDRDVICVAIAGLCHDLGHGPWSHVWDSQFIPKALQGKKWQHEDASEMMFDDLILKNQINISEDDAIFVKALIAGDPERCNKSEKPFLFEIVANKRNGIDVDKFDYIARDSHAIGEKGNISLTRLIHSARVIENQICYDIKDANTLYELCYTRFSLHKRIYNHKTAKAIEYMIVDALLAADPHMRIAEQVDQPDRYVYLTDDIMPRIEMSTEPELARSREIFDRLRTRDLYRCVDYKVFGWGYRDKCREHITPENIVEAAKLLSITPVTPHPHHRGELPQPAHEQDEQVDPAEESIDSGSLEALDAKDVIVDMSPMHYGMKEKNPLDEIRFYSKNNPDKCEQAGPGDVSLLMPASFGEVLLRVYTKDRRYYGIVQAGYRAVLATMPGIASSPSSTPVADADGPAASARLASPYRATTPPLTLSHEPSTPEAKTGGGRAPLSRARSEMIVGFDGVKSPFTNNKFTTVGKTYVPVSPTQQHRRKRSREEAEGEMSPVKKSR